MLTQPLLKPVVSPALAEFAEDVRIGLTKPGQREILSKYLYDEVGSALFEAICLLPEYGLTRADTRLLQRHAREMVARMPRPAHVAELGSGSGKKTRWILEALARYQHKFYYPIEISPAALAACEKELGQMDLVHIVGYEKPYFEGLRAVVNRREPGEHVCVLFLGSTIGNFDRPAADAFLRQVRSILEPGDSLLLGTDLEKSIEVQLLAYDDPAGVTAAFNLNVLARINRELGADFDLKHFGTSPSAASKCICAPCNASAWTFPAPACAFASKKAKPSGRKVRTNILRPNPSKWRRAPASTAKHSGSTKRGLSPRICGLSNKT